MHLDGSTDVNKHYAVVQTFNSGPSIDCLLLTTCWGAWVDTYKCWYSYLCETWLESNEGPAGHGPCSLYRPEEGGQCVSINYKRDLGREDHGVCQVMAYVDAWDSFCSSLQCFKLNITNTVVTQQNLGLVLMDTDLILDLFRHTTIPNFWDLICW